MSDRARIEVRLGFTKNIGSYESVRIDTGFSDTVRDDEDVADAQSRVYDVVERELISKLEDVLKEIDEVNG